MLLHVHQHSSEAGSHLLQLFAMQALNLTPALATGLILVSCCPGGQVRPVHTHLLNANVVHNGPLFPSTFLANPFLPLIAVHSKEGISAAHMLSLLCIAHTCYTLLGC